MEANTSTQTLPARPKNAGCCVPAHRPALSSEQTELVAQRLKALADATRLRILDLLAQQSAPLCVCDITEQFPQNQPTISHHLRLLRTMGLIETEKGGIWSYYWATDEGRRTLQAIQTLVP